jgi:hypothetical protein
MAKELEAKDQIDDVEKVDSKDEVASQDAAELPDREEMSLINANLAAPINAAVALNALSDNSEAVAIAHQDTPITQSN